MVVGLLGILKAGGAYVSLDERYPAERLSFMLEDSGVRVLLTEERLLERLPDYDGRVVYLDAEEFSPQRRNGTKGKYLRISFAPLRLGGRKQQTSSALT